MPLNPEQRELAQYAATLFGAEVQKALAEDRAARVSHSTNLRTELANRHTIDEGYGPRETGR